MRALAEIYKLCNHVISKYKGDSRYNWTLWTAGSNDDHIITMYSGPVIVDFDNNVTIIEPYKDTATIINDKPYGKLREQIDSFPQWDKTTFFIRQCEMGGYLVLECLSGKRIKNEETERIVRTLGFMEAVYDRMN